MFSDAQGSAAYLFMQGGSTDLVVQFTNRSGAFGSGAAGMRISAGAGFGGGSALRVNLG